MDKQPFRHALERSLYGSLLGVLYAWVNLEWKGSLVLTCATIGLLIGFFTYQLDHLLFLTRLRRRRFAVVLLVRTLAYLLVITLSVLLVTGAYTALDNRMSLQAVMASQLLQGWISSGGFTYIVVYSLVVLLVFQFITLVSRLLGPNVLINYLIGRYHVPKEEERIFMFMDIRSSTTIAERLGHVMWHQFLNDYFFDIAKPVRRSRGEIYQYVGDEVVISWPKKTGLRHLNCIRCFFWIWDLMQARREWYLKKYGYEPIFKAGYHVGKVIMGEIGDYKRDIVFHGDTVNTASRIQVECNRFNRRLLLSDILLKQLDLKDEYVAEYITKIRLRGKENDLDLYSLDPVDAHPNLVPTGSIDTIRAARERRALRRETD
jgi:adenylate cyclase